MGGAGRVREALREAERLLADHPDDTEARLAAGDVFLALGDAARAERLARGVLTAEPQSVPALVLLGSAILRRLPPGGAPWRRRVVEARRYLTRAVAARPHYAGARTARAIASRALGDDAEALRDLNAVLDRRTHPTALGLRAELRFDQGRYVEALEDARAAQELLGEDRDLPRLLGVMGGCLTKLGRLDEAIPLLRRSAEEDASRQNHQAHLFLGLALIRSRVDVAEGVRVLDRLLAKRPNHAPALLVRSNGLMGLKRWAAAERDARRVLELTAATPRATIRAAATAVLDKIADARAAASPSDGRGPAPRRR